MSGEGGGEPEEALPPALVAYRVVVGGEPRPLPARVGAVRLEAQPDPGRLLRGIPVPLPALRAARLLVASRRRPAQRDAVEQALGVAAGQVPLAGGLFGAEAPVQLRRLVRVAQLR